MRYAKMKERAYFEYCQAIRAIMAAGIRCLWRGDEGSTAFFLSLLELGVREINDRAIARPSDLVDGSRMARWPRRARDCLARESSKLFNGRAAKVTLFFTERSCLQNADKSGIRLLGLCSFRSSPLERGTPLSQTSIGAPGRNEALERRVGGDYRGVSLSDIADNLASVLQADVEHLLYDQDDIMLLFNSLASA